MMALQETVVVAPTKEPTAHDAYYQPGVDVR